MAETFLIREVLNKKVVKELAESIKKNFPDFDKEGFCKMINKEIDALQFNERGKLITDALEKYLPQDFLKASEILIKSLMPEIKGEELAGYDRFIVWPQTSYIARKGLNHFDRSMKALYEMTKRFTAEGDIRYFIEKYPEQSLTVLNKWAKDKNCHVRRLVSEGTRPRLPWGKRLNTFKNNQEPIIKLLSILRDDETLYVRRSVANHLNDIAKESPDLVVKTLKQWKKEGGNHIDWIIKHATRTLIKQGHSGAMSLLGVNKDIKVSVKYLKVKESKINIGGRVSFEAEVINHEKSKKTLIVDYIIYFMKNNGKLSPKVFKLTKKELKPGESLKLSKSHSMKIMTTRKLYPGKHFLALQVNGIEKKKTGFFLL